MSNEKKIRRKHIYSLAKRSNGNTFPLIYHLSPIKDVQRIILHWLQSRKICWWYTTRGTQKKSFIPHYPDWLGLVNCSIIYTTYSCTNHLAHTKWKSESSYKMKIRNPKHHVSMLISNFRCTIFEDYQENDVILQTFIYLFYENICRTSEF